MISQLALSAALLFFPGSMIYAAIVDLATMTIRNGLVLVLVGAYVVLAPLAGMGLADIGTSVAVAAAVLFAGFALFSLDVIGGGDVKFAAATALWLGSANVPIFLIYTALFGGLLAVALLAFRVLPLPEGSCATTSMAHLRSRQAGIPYAVAMAPAALLVLPDTFWLTALTTW